MPTLLLLVIRRVPCNELLHHIGVSESLHQTKVAMDVHKTLCPPRKQPVPLAAVDEVERGPVALTGRCIGHLQITNQTSVLPNIQHNCFSSNGLQTHIEPEHGIHGCCHIALHNKLDNSMNYYVGKESIPKQLIVTT